MCQLAKLAETHPATWVIWLARGGGTQPIKRFVNDPLRERDQVAVRANMLATRGDGNVEFHPQTVITGIECAGADRGFKVRAVCAGKAVTWETDRLIANVGYTPDNSLYRELQVHESFVSLGPMNLASTLLKHPGGDGLALSSPGGAVLRNPEPNFFILGAKSYGRNAHFLLRTGFEQVREVFAMIASDADLKRRFPGLRQMPKMAV